MKDYGYGGNYGFGRTDSDMARVHLAGAGDKDYYNAKPGDAYLPHSCDDWAIGDADNVRLMIADLQAVLAKMEGR